MKALGILLMAVATMTTAAVGASDGKSSRTEQLALYRANARAPVESFQYFGRLDGWTPLGDRAVAVWTRPREAYLIEVDDPCPDLDFADAIGLTTQVGRVYARFDQVIPRAFGGGARPVPCRIREIRPLDVKALKSAEQDVRERRAREG